MKKDMLFRELVQLDREAADQTEVFTEIADVLFKHGFVKDTYLEALKTREEKYPTALPIEPYPVAIPHTDTIHINRPFIAPVRLKQPVEWREMANNDAVHQIRFIFMLGFLKSDEHVELLQVLVENFQNKELMEQLEQAETADEYFELVCGMKGMEE
ncbi:MAG: PTS sugar transporter subunit IIA [Lachnospiraceae bacterium]